MKEENGLKANVNESLKRKSEDADILPSKQKKKIPKNTQPKNALMRLNELKPGLHYNIDSQEGPPHNPTFIVSVEVNGQKFTGRGHSKQMAKCAAAEFALATFDQFQNTQKAAIPVGKNSCDFTTDDVENETSNFNQFGGEKQNIISPTEDTNITEKQNQTQKILEKEEKNPVMLLNEVHPGSEFNLIRENALVPSERFTMSVCINGITFEGSGQNKKLAKAAAARSALSSLYGITSSETPTNKVSIPEAYVFPQAIADKISDVIHKTFQEIMVGNTDYAKWKVLAGIVMTSDPEMNKIKIVGISTGTKGINGKNISMNGACLNDCHAEILARRCLKNFLYYNLELIAVGQKEDSILIAEKTGGYRLKPNIKFHLYISTSPCGDARIILPDEPAAKERQTRRPFRRARGVLRMKLENREGTMPIKIEDEVQTWDAISLGHQKLTTMSCSDKIASWNVLGIQGALLSCFVEPIYLESIIFGSIVHPGHIFRAMWSRFENSLEGLPKHYYLKKPKMCCVSNPEKPQFAKTPNFSVNWTVGFGRPEIINATTGKLENGEVSRLSKRSFFDHFIKLYGKISSVTNQKINKKPNLYSEAKNSVASYQAAKEELRKAFKRAGLGTWVRKPVEQDDFELVF